MAVLSSNKYILKLIKSTKIEVVAKALLEKYTCLKRRKWAGWIHTGK